MGRLAAYARLRHQTVERYVAVGEFPCKAAGDVDLAVEILAEEFFIGNGKQELLDDEYLCAGLFLYLGENLAVIRFEGLVIEPFAGLGSVPGVVDADMNGNEIGLNVDEIGLQTGDEIYRLIAAYAEVDKFKIRVGMLAADILRSVEG